MPRNHSRRGPLPRPSVSFDDPTVTRFSGLLPLIRFLENTLRLPDALKPHGCKTDRRRDFQVNRVHFALIVASLAGISRLAHLDLLRDDRGLHLALRQPRLPSRKVYSSSLNEASDLMIQQLTNLVASLGAQTIPASSSYILDFDNTSLVAHGSQEGTEFGYCGKGRRRRRYLPIVAAYGDGGAVANVDFRDGSSMTSREQMRFVHATIAKTTALRKAGPTAIRMDSGFFSRSALEDLTEKKISFAMVHPMNTRLKLFLWKTQMTELEGDPDIELGEIDGAPMGYPEGTRVVVIRRAVHDRKAPPQGKKVNFDPHGRYQAIITNLESDYDAYDVWNFYNHRARCERVFRDGKQALGMGHLVSHSRRGNETAFLLRLIAYNADILFQQAAERAAREHGEKVVRMGLEYRQSRFYNLAGRLVQRRGSWVLRLPPNPRLKKLFRFYAYDLRVNG